ncbi:hypothetical protein CBS147339_7221 [Penicillium roqueforti]|nr:hypothetical protein CBS147318_7394 [Penicillium roqueforti]KAI3071252.1 hypothetical protein CBS147339_7221 [Penicillium roqueforti]KAI3101277.1 hypothetical protein CBS147338_3137 [Penicillium roqueforti]KAI3124708.1 hypothetical protein CBS147330_6668 [Penicillium roqueforti]KAI3183713.1 hypothetical protein DTO032C6_6620 [Penicillium roqueforti]
MKPITSEHEPQTTQWDEGQVYVKTCHNATRKALALLLSRSNEENLHITTTELELSSGDPLDYGPRFVVKAFHYSLDNFFGENMPAYILDEDNNLGSVYAPQWQWKLAGWTNAKKASQPHINAFIVDSQPHLIDRLNSGEVSVSYGLIAKRRLEDGYNDHRYIPITVFSVSDFQVRILQIWHDKQNPKALQIRSSRIMDFKDGIQNNLDDWVTILCWIAGESVGDTRNGFEVVQPFGNDA